MAKIYFFWVFFLSVLTGGGNAFADVTIAVVAPKAGEYAKAGSELFKGAAFAVNEINDNGGLNGEKAELLTIDDRCDKRLAVSTAEMLSVLNSKRIGLVVGPYCAEGFNEAASIYEKAKIFQIVPTTEVWHTADADKKGRILLLGTKGQMSRDFFEFYNNNFAGLKVGFFYNDRSEYGYAEVAKTLFDEFRRFGKSELLKFYAFNAGENEAYELCKMIEKDGIQIVFVLGGKDEVPEFIRTLRRKNKDVIVFSGKNMLTADFFKEAGKDFDGLYVIDLPGLKDSLAFTDVLVDLRLSGVEPEGLFVYGYFAVKLWGDLAKEAKSFSFEKLSELAGGEEMKEKLGDFLMHSGRFGTAKYIIEMYKDGAFKQVY